MAAKENGKNNKSRIRIQLIQCNELGYKCTRQAGVSKIIYLSAKPPRLLRNPLQYDGWKESGAYASHFQGNRSWWNQRQENGGQGEVID